MSLCGTHKCFLLEKTNSVLYLFLASSSPFTSLYLISVMLPFPYLLNENL